jgi:hypothetical protein
MTNLDELKAHVNQRLKGVNRHWDKLDAIEDYEAKDHYMRSPVFIGANLALISAQERYIQALEQALESK